MSSLVATSMTGSGSDIFKGTVFIFLIYKWVKNVTLSPFVLNNLLNNTQKTQLILTLIFTFSMVMFYISEWKKKVLYRL